MSNIDTIQTIILIAIAIAIAIGIGICLLLREFFCWYYKVNHIVVLLKSIDDKLGKLVDNTNQKESSNENKYNDSNWSSKIISFAISYSFLHPPGGCFCFPLFSYLQE